jgi:hypothetical protein
MNPFITVIVKDLLLLICIPLIAEIGGYLLSKKEKVSDTDIAIEDSPVLL